MAPGRRAAIAGLAGIHAVSRLEFPDRVLRLTVTYVFPDRARWTLEDYDAAVPKGEQIYRQGTLAHRLPFAESSRVLEGLDREHTLLQMELRRAALLWPDGFAWTNVEGARETEVFADSCCRRERLGVLRARETEAGLVLEARDAHGDLRETLTLASTQELAGRRWPQVILGTGVNASFRETLESIETRIHYLDLAFLPGDRRRVGAASAPEERIGARDLVPMTYAERELDGGVTWEQALARARALQAELLPALPTGLALDPVPTFELGDDGRPTRCLVRLTKSCEPPPEGFVSQRERIGLFQSLTSLAALDAQRLARLRAAVPEGAQAGRAYVRVHEPGRVELVLPVVPP